jgi:hypothetical protein
LLETLKKLLPEEQFEEVAAAVEEMLDEAKQQIEKDAQAELDKAYEAVAAEVAEAERVALEGYAQAHAIIVDQDNRMESQKEAYEKAIDEQYEDAYKMIEEERGKNNDIESSMYEEYDNKLSEMKGYIVDKVDEFLKFKGQEIYEQAKHDVLNDPRMAEHRVALDKITDIMADFLTEEELQLGTSKKLEEAQKKVERLQADLKKQEGRNIRLSTDNTKLGQQLEEAVNILQEQEETEVVSEQNERAKKAAKVQGRGHSNMEEEKLLSEYNAETPEEEEPQGNGEVLVEGLDEIKKLAGYK